MRVGILQYRGSETCAKLLAYLLQMRCLQTPYKFCSPSRLEERAAFRCCNRCVRFVERNRQRGCIAARYSAARLGLRGGGWGGFAAMYTLRTVQYQPRASKAVRRFVRRQRRGREIVSQERQASASVDRNRCQHGCHACVTRGEWHRKSQKLRKCCCTLAAEINNDAS